MTEQEIRAAAIQAASRIRAPAWSTQDLLRCAETIAQWIRDARIQEERRW
jgi:hypothetical protein